ncbi:hypothetical protein IMZ29_17645 [Achromobacter sp. GG226]|uniref:hypothetical protein n=1 Tax=Verticiella alkaliphila TaxID=2779529 RepID=UPI001C0AAEAB|nr:hypothetical protein [Verticiella sp. GG226]MBU4612300.1 hypothetical protein [Verticiella sp. GG226]
MNDSPVRATWRRKKRERQQENLPELNLGISSLGQMLEKLGRESARLHDSFDMDHVLNFAFTAHHLYFDWVRRVGQDEMKARQAAMPPDAKAVLDVMRDIANGSKHAILNRDLDKIVVRRFEQDRIQDWHDYFFAPPGVVTFGMPEDPHDYVASVRDLAPTVLAYLRWVIEGPPHPAPETQRQALLSFKQQSPKP